MSKAGNTSKATAVDDEGGELDGDDFGDYLDKLMRDGGSNI